MEASKLAMKDVGEGRAVLLLHGCPSTTVQFTPLVERLAKSRRVLVPDLPGYGASPPLPGTYTIARVTELLEEALLSRGIAEVAIVGHSGGAYRALALALAGRVRVTDVVTLGGIAGFDPPVADGFRGFAAALRRGDDLHPLALPRFTAPGFAAAHPKEAAEVVSWLDAAPAAVLAAELEAFAAAEDLRPRLGQLKASVVARVGEVDQACPVAFSREIVDRAPKAALQVVPGCGHALLYEDRDATVAAVAEALGA